MRAHGKPNGVCDGVEMGPVESPGSEPVFGRLDVVATARQPKKTPARTGSPRSSAGRHSGSRVVMSSDFSMP